jgi:hypothetical protein
MKLSKAAKIWIDYHKTHSKKNTVRAYPIGHLEIMLYGDEYR